MRRVRQFAAVLLCVIVGCCLAAEFIAPTDYATQFRESPDARPSREHPLGLDDLGRDRFSRVLYGSRISLLLAPTAALLSTLIAAVVGGMAGFFGGPIERLAMAFTDLVLALPWLFLLLVVRALLPLNVSPLTSVLITFLMLGLLGWAVAARILCAGAKELRTCDFVLQARGSGIGGARLLVRHVLPNLVPVMRAQFWLAIPVFILSEANLSLLGLGVAEPMPSWGSLLRELEGFVSFSAEPWKLVPLALLVIVVSSFQILLSSKDATL